MEGQEVHIKKMGFKNIYHMKAKKNKLKHVKRMRYIPAWWRANRITMAPFTEHRRVWAFKLKCWLKHSGTILKRSVQAEKAKWCVSLNMSIPIVIIIMLFHLTMQLNNNMTEYVHILFWNHANAWVKPVTLFVLFFTFSCSSFFFFFFFFFTGFVLE